MIEAMKTEAANQFRETLVVRRDFELAGAPMWYGWALHDAFIAGIKWQMDHSQSKIANTGITYMGHKIYVDSDMPLYQLDAMRKQLCEYFFVTRRP